MEPRHPKIFLSHASEDKDRFVLRFAARLRAHGVEAWVDQWEILPGDSLVEKIFEEGLKNAEAVIVVLSSTSVTKPWVREELDAAVVKKISGKTQLIPVVLDSCEVPEALRSTVWVTIKNIQSYDEEFERILAAIYGHANKPPVGPVPRYVSSVGGALPRLNQIDTVVFKTACEQSVQSSKNSMDTGDVADIVRDLDISRQGVSESLDILVANSFINIIARYASGEMLFSVTASGFQEYSRVFNPGFDKLVDHTMLAIVNKNLWNDVDIATYLAQPKMVIDYALELLEKRGYLNLMHIGDGSVRISNVTTIGKRAAQNL